MTKRLTRRAMAQALSALSLAAVLIGSAPAGATIATTCTFHLATHTVFVTVTGDLTSAAIMRNGSQIEVNGSPCLDIPALSSANVTNTDLIRVTGGPGNQSVSILLAGGPFAPGFSNEPGGSDEIEFRISSGGGTEALQIAGSGGNDRIRFGVASGTPKANLNASESTGVDADVRTKGVEVFGGTYGNGDDVVSGVGGKGTGAEFTHPLNFVGSLGDDRLTGGTQTDFLLDNSPGSVPDNDADVLNGRGGGDTLQASDLDILDELFGGTGGDSCSGDPGDLLVSC